MPQKLIFVSAAVWTLVCFSAFAGGPEMWIDKAHVLDVVFDNRGVVVTLSGEATLVASRSKSGKNSRARFVKLPMKTAQLRYLGGELYAVSDEEMYRARLRAMKGTEQSFQLWGTTAVIEGGYLTRVTARIVSGLMPQNGERRFAVERLNELENSPK